VQLALAAYELPALHVPEPALLKSSPVAPWVNTLIAPSVTGEASVDEKLKVTVAEPGVEPPTSTVPALVTAADEVPSGAATTYSVKAGGVSGAE
jgi:hypothetical protein